jgi:hypothetical protein
VTLSTSRPSRVSAFSSRANGRCLETGKRM